MKRFLFLLVVVFFTCLSVHGQVALVTDAILDEFLIATGAEQLIYWAGIADQWIKEAEHFKFVVENTGKQIDMAMKNLESLKKVENFDDFKSWYNRQLYLEVSAIDTIKGMDVKIGNKSYSMWDIDGIADGLDDTYIQYWNKEFTEEQRREMWINMGLTPSNYAYVQPYRKKAREVSREMFAMSEIQNRKNMAYYDELKFYSDLVNEDFRDPSLIGSKGYQQIHAKSLFRIENALMDTNAMLAKQLEAQGIKDALDRTPDSQPPMADWSNNGFEEF